MDSESEKTICKIRYYKGQGSYQITIPKNIVDKLKLQKTDFVEITITPVLRSSEKKD